MDILIRCTDVSICVVCCKKHWRHRQMFQTHSPAFIHTKVGLIFSEGMLKKCKIINLNLK